MHSISGNNSLNARRAAEEGIGAYVYEHADTQGYYANVEAVDFDLLKTIKGMTSHFEVGRRTLGDWERAILEEYRLFRLLRGHHGGVIVANLITRTLQCSSSRTDENGL